MNEENVYLKKELAVLKARSLHDKNQIDFETKLKTQQDGGDLSKATKNLYQAEAAYRSLVEREATTWLYVENFQLVMKKFFRFQLEEEDMRSKVEEVFKLLESSRSRVKGGATLVYTTQEQGQVLSDLNGMKIDQGTLETTKGGKHINTGKISLPTINSSASPHNSKKNRANYLNEMKKDANGYIYV
jgi:hypothetical protein